MKVYVKCERCKKEGAPQWRAGAGQQLSNYDPGHHVPPAGWNVVAGHTLCGDCADIIERTLRDALNPPQAAP